MSRVDVTMVRVYLVEGRDPVSKVLKRLEKAEVKGYTVFRGLAGQGDDHKRHQASLLDLSNELPVVIEFYDTPARAEEMIDELASMVKADHIVSWPAQSGNQ